MSRNHVTSAVKPASAAYLLIGDEVLNGTVRDTNGLFLAKYFRNKGIDLRRIEVIPDKLEDIVDSIRRNEKKVDYIVTSGGIGPTHDDITYEAVAAAFNTTVEYDPGTLDRLTTYMKSRNSVLTEERKRMALFPKDCKTFLASDELWVPVVIMGNVHIFPGVPRLFEKMLLGCDSIFVGGKPFVQYEVFTNMLEGDIAKQMSQIALDNPQVKIGSYPSSEHGHLRLFIEGRDEEEVQKVAKLLESASNAFKVARRDTDAPQHTPKAKL